MAKRLKDKYEHDVYIQIIQDVADYVILNNASTRETAKYFTDKGIKMSNYTVSNFLNSKILKIYAPEKFEKVQNILNDKLSSKVFNDSDVLVRVQKAVELLLQGYTVSQIALELNSTEDIIYDDLISRLKRFESEEIVNLVSDELQKHRMNNLKNVNKKR